jgi:hypothetical protein
VTCSAQNTGHRIKYRKVDAYRNYVKPPVQRCPKPPRPNLGNDRSREIVVATRVTAETTQKSVPNDVERRLGHDRSHASNERRGRRDSCNDGRWRD